MNAANHNQLLARFALPAIEEAGGWSVYLVLCRNGSLYCGISNRPQARFAAHASGRGAKYMRIHKPVAMRLVCAGVAHGEAAQLEVRVKKLAAGRKRELWALLPDFQTA
ncbi:GIY-YIG nuclease family protein [Neisseria dentiae]|uniref:GIY-YIG nuclease family protein n=1 Tax=Neisseria dentiae TaxID=194197 RepID=UPI000DFBE6E1|nr:putative endonuclease [Neisseria dentiae]